MVPLWLGVGGGPLCVDCACPDVVNAGVTSVGGAVRVAHFCLVYLPVCVSEVRTSQPLHDGCPVKNVGRLTYCVYACGQSRVGLVSASVHTGVWRFVEVAHDNHHAGLGVGLAVCCERAEGFGERGD